MFRLNLDGLTDASLERLISARCSVYGQVASVRVFRGSEAEETLFALVTMSSDGERSALMEGVGDMIYGESVYIRLEDKHR